MISESHLVNQEAFTTEEARNNHVNNRARPGVSSRPPSSSLATPDLTLGTHMEWPRWRRWNDGNSQVPRPVELLLPLNVPSVSNRDQCRAASMARCPKGTSWTLDAEVTIPGPFHYRRPRSSSSQGQILWAWFASPIGRASVSITL